MKLNVSNFEMWDFTLSSYNYYVHIKNFVTSLLNSYLLICFGFVLQPQPNRRLLIDFIISLGFGGCK